MLIILISSVVIVTGCDTLLGSTTTTPSDSCVAQGYINATEAQKLVTNFNKYVGVNNLCMSQNIPVSSYTLLQTFDTSCGQDGYVKVSKANEMVTEMNRYIDVANRCTGGQNYADIKHWPLYVDYS